MCCLQAVFARFKTKIYSKFFRFFITTARKKGNVRGGTEIVNPFIVPVAY